MATDDRSERYHALDALRGFALLLGISFHAAESFCPGRYSWAILDRYPHDLFNFFQHACHSFRMEIFFLIAGFFARLVIERKGVGRFVRQRSLRILLPFVVGWWLIYPAILTIWLWGHSVSGRLEYLGVPPESRHLSPLWLGLGSLLSGDFLADGFNLAHLWFLYYLLMIYAGALALRWTVGFSGFSEGVLPRVDRLTAWLMRSRWKVFLLALISAVFIRLMGGGVSTPNRSLWPDPAVLGIYGFCFLLGWLLHRSPELWKECRPGWKAHLLLGIALVYPTGSGRRIAQELALGDWGGQILLGVHCFLYGLMMWGFVLGIAGCFLAYRQQASPAWRYVADSSYWLYLVHLQFLVPVQILLAGVDLHWAIKYPLINLIVFPVLFLSYDLFVRSTWVGVVLNGRRYSRLITWSKTAKESGASTSESPAA